MKSNNKPKYDIRPLLQAQLAHGYTNVVIAKAIRRDASVVSRAMRGKHLSPPTIKAIAGFLDVEMIDLSPKQRE